MAISQRPFPRMQRPLSVAPSAFGKTHRGTTCHRVTFWYRPNTGQWGVQKLPSACLSRRNSCHRPSNWSRLTVLNRLPPKGGVNFIHILFDHHEIIQANGVLIKSYLLTERSKHLTNELDQFTAPVALPTASMPPARPVVDAKKCHSLVRRLLKNNKPVFKTFQRDQEFLQAA